MEIVLDRYVFKLSKLEKNLMLTTYPSQASELPPSQSSFGLSSAVTNLPEASMAASQIMRLSSWSSRAPCSLLPVVVLLSCTLDFASAVSGQEETGRLGRRRERLAQRELRYKSLRRVNTEESTKV